VNVAFAELAVCPAPEFHSYRSAPEPDAFALNVTDSAWLAEDGPEICASGGPTTVTEMPSVPCPPCPSVTVTLTAFVPAPAYV
jgi:hypothetical protein